MWITSNQEKKYWIPDNFPEPIEEYNVSQSLKEYMTQTGRRTHPGWKYDNGALVDDEYLFYNENWKLLVDIPPVYNSETHVLQKKSEEDWDNFEKEVAITYHIREKTIDEVSDSISKKWNEVRLIRNKKLSKLDHIIDIAFENGFTLTQKFKKYRQDLRDIPENFQDPFFIVWPDEISQWEYYE